MLASKPMGTHWLPYNSLTQPQSEVVELSDEEWDVIKQRMWDNYETVGYQGERFMYEGDFYTAMDVTLQELQRWGIPQSSSPVPVIPTEEQRLAADAITDENGKRWDRTMDAVLWAKAFCILYPNNDEANMLSWFANAIMCGWDHHAWKSSPQTEEPDFMQAMADAGYMFGKDALDNAFVGWNLRESYPIATRPQPVPSAEVG